ncbi:MAG TPA: amidohydrolase, partial [Mycobacterium sp.]|nr:amidohydrolase [Mycobacterium sp.]
MASLDEMLNDTSFTTAVKGKVTFLPEPERAPRPFPFISVDDHIVESKNTFEDRMPARFQDRAPRVIDKNGADVWIYDGKEFPNVGFNAVVGR